MNYLEEFRLATEQCTEQLRVMLPMEEEKRKAVISDNTDRMEEMMAAQQAAMMRLESLERNRNTLQEKAGYGGMTADEMLEALPESEKEGLRVCFADLRETANQLKLSNEKAMEMVRANLQFWEALERRSKKPPTTAKTTYRPDGGQTSVRISSAFEKKI